MFRSLNDRSTATFPSSITVSANIRYPFLFVKMIGCTVYKILDSQECYLY